MNRNAGFAVLAAIVVAAMRLGPSAAPAAAPTQAAPPAHYGNQQKRPATAGRPECTAYISGSPKQNVKDRNRGAALAVVKNFFGSVTSGPSDARYAIALLPDPRHTNLSLQFDREMVAIQEAAQDEGYVYDSSWMPWGNEKKVYTRLEDQEQEDDQIHQAESCPGLLLFRRSAKATVGDEASAPYEQSMVVLVVGEQPTGGINQPEWDAAVQWTEGFPATAPQGGGVIHILGPTFSGSLPSLNRSLDRIYGGTPDVNLMGFKRRFPTAHVLSGSVSSLRAIEKFRDQLKMHSPVQFGVLRENDEVQLARYQSYLNAHGTNTEDMAIVSEDETAYGNRNDCAVADPVKCPRDLTLNGPVNLYYPRDISALREAYEKQALFSPSAGGGHAGHIVLQETSGNEVDAADDTVTSYAGALSAISQEAILYGIVSYLRSHHTRYVLLRCSNPLDFLFLTRFFHRTYPQARIVTVGADMLFRREIDTTEFRGVESLSNYPLLPELQHWSALTSNGKVPPGHAHRVFEQPIVEGRYVVARYLFDRNEPWFAQGSTDPGQLQFLEKSYDYADPFWIHKPWEIMHSSAAPTWLAVVGRDGYWPLAVLRDAVDGEPHSTMVTLASSDAQYRKANDAKVQLFNDQLLFKTPLPWKLCMGCALLVLIYQALGLWRYRSRDAGGAFAVFKFSPSTSQAFLIGCNSALAVSFAGILLSIGWLFPTVALMGTGRIAYWVNAGLAAAIFLAVGLLLRLYGWLAMLTFGLVVAATEVLLILCFPFWRVGYNGIPLMYRMSHLTSGVSPLVPLLLVFAGFYLWSWAAMAGNLMLSKGKPLLPRFDNVRINDAAGNRIVNMAKPLSPSLQVILLPMVLCVAALCYFHSDLPLLSMEDQNFALFINLALLAASLVVTAEALRLYWTWIRLRRLLVELNRLRLRRTFAKLIAVEARSLWSVSGNVERVQFNFFSQQLDAANRLIARLDKKIFWRTAKAAQWNSKFTRERSPSPIQLAEGRENFAAAVGEVFRRILTPRWAREENSLNLETESAPDADGGRNVLAMQLSNDPTVQIAEEFVCFQYIAFIQIILARMRTMTLSMVCLFVAVCFAISFYPFVPRTQVSMWMMANLALIGFAVIYVYAGMERDTTLSHITNTKPGHLGSEFWLKTAAFLAGPVIGILTTQFPAIADSVLSWLQPGLDSLGRG